jgi:DNA-binding response OmpR family regulator
MNAKRILIADDEPNIQTMVRVCLSTEGYDLSVVSNGQEAIDRLRQGGTDLLLLDLAMPVMEGMAVLRELLDRPLATPVRIIVMTAHGSVRTAVQAIRLGASDFLEKPFRPEDLRTSVASVLHEEMAENGGASGMARGYDQVLKAVRALLREGRLTAAESLLMRAGTIADNEPGFLNLAGVVHEANGRPSSARRFYQKALLSDPAYRPAKQNIDRLDEINRSGDSQKPIDLGDHAPVLSENHG